MFNTVEKNIKVAEQNISVAEENIKVAEENIKVAEQNISVAEKNIKVAEKNIKVAEKYIKVAEQNISANILLKDVTFPLFIIIFFNSDKIPKSKKEYSNKTESNLGSNVVNFLIIACSSFY